MTRATPKLAIALAVALGMALGGCESDDGAASQGPRSWWSSIFDADPSSEPPSAADSGARADDRPAPAPSPPATATDIPSPSATAEAPPAAADPPPVEAAPPPPSSRVQPALLSRQDPMLLKKALQDGEALPVSLPREIMVKLFRTLEPFQPSAQQLKIIEAYGRQTTATEQARLRYELQSCRPSSTCVVVPQR